MDLSPELESDRLLVDQRLDSILPRLDRRPEVLHAAMRYSALAPGKRLRPLLAMATAEAVGGNGNSCLDAACAIELVHCFSLIHDDLPAIDDDDLRRGLPTCHKTFGEAVALLAGDALFSLSFEIMGTCSRDAGKANACVLALASATGTEGLVGGEVLDVLSEGAEPDLDLLRTIHRRKTGALIAASCQIGAILGGAEAEKVSQAKEFGHLIGLAFQIVDDVLNETSTREDLGKAVRSDGERGKLTFPKLMGLQPAQAAAERAASDALGKLNSFAPGAEKLLSLAAFTVARRW